LRRPTGQHGKPPLPPPRKKPISGPPIKAKPKVPLPSQVDTEIGSAAPAVEAKPGPAEGVPAPASRVPTDPGKSSSRRKRATAATETLGNQPTPVSGELLMSADPLPDRGGAPPPAPEDMTMVAAAPEEPKDPLADEGRRSIAAFKRELEREDDPLRIGRLHYEIARIEEGILANLDEAEAHYAQALEADPDLLPAIVGARRTRLLRKDYARALLLFDREVRVTADQQTKASLLLAKARLLEDQLDRVDEARKTFAAGLEISASDPVLLKAMEQADRQMAQWDALSDDYAQTGNAVGSDPRHRAAMVVRRARLLEVQHDDPDAAAELYEAALAVDPKVPGALDALKRLHYGRRRWRELIRVLEREAEGARDVSVRMMAHYRIGQIHADRLGNRREAITALERAVSEAPDQPFVLDTLARLYEQAGSQQSLADTLERLTACTADPRERLGYLHRIGDLYRDRLADDDASMKAYERALGIDPAYIPALRALGPMYQAKERWDDLVKMHEAEVAAVHDARRRAVAHARAAEILERVDRWTEATGHHERALALDPELQSSFRALVRLYERADDHHKLIELYERAIDRVDDERKVEYLFAIGDIYRGPLRDPEQAEAAYKRILRLRPKHLGAVHAIQRTAESAGRWRQLVEALELETRMIDDDHEKVSLLHRAGDVLLEQLGLRGEAIARFKRVLELDGHHRATLASLGRIYHSEGHWADLVEVYRRDLDVTEDPAAMVSLLHKMGEVYARFLANTDRALECFRDALAIDPRHGPSAQALARLLRERADWKALVELTGNELRHARDTNTQAMAAFRAGEIYEEHLDDKQNAEVYYQQATALRPADRPASEALSRVRTHLAHYTELAEELEARAAKEPDAYVAITTLLRAGEAWSDRVGALQKAIACYESVLERDPDHMLALIAVEPLYRETRQWDKLAETYARQTHVFNDTGAKVAALTERARCIRENGVGTTKDLVEVYSEILAIRPGERAALEGLERLAMEAHEPRVIASVSERLAEATHSSELKSAYLTRQAEALEAIGQIKCLDIFRKAVRLDGRNRAALRGLARVAEMVGHGKAMAEAAELQARVAKLPPDVAAAWVRHGVIQLEQLEDQEGAIQSFERALFTYADHVDAAERISRQLRELGRYEVLVERLTRAAGEAKTPERQSALWIEVSQIYAEELNNLGAALSALRRLTDAQPNNPEALCELARLMTGDRRYDEAVVLLQKTLKLEPEGRLVLRVHRLLATCYQQLDDAPTAFQHYFKALELKPNDRQLLQALNALQFKVEDFKAAVETSTRLVRISRDDDERVEGLMMVARAKAEVGRKDEAIDHLAEAVSIEGSRSDAAEAVRELAQSADEWRHYAKGLHQRIEARTRDPKAKANLYLDLARVYAEDVGSDKDAMSVLAEGLRQCNSDARLRYQLAMHLRAANRLGEAIEQLQYMLMDDVTRVEAWRAMAQSFEALGRPRERVMALAPLVLLGDADPGEADQVRSWEPATRSIPPGGFSARITSDIWIAREQQAAAANLLSAISESLVKVRAPELGNYGVGWGDKVRTDSPLRMVIDRIASLFALEEFDVYMHRQRDKGVIVENGSRPAVLIPPWLNDLRPSRQVFHIGRALFNISRGVFPIDLFSARELEVLLAAAARTMNPQFGSNVASPDLLEDRQRLILKGLPRRKRKAFETSAATYARAQQLDVSTFVQWAQQTSRRVALILADDLVGSIEELTRVEDFGGDRGRALVTNSAVVSDLVKVWVSKPAMALRQRCGLLPPPSGANPAVSPYSGQQR
jgi:tetratricopeptide (TPR) repeat protein